MKLQNSVNDLRLLTPLQSFFTEPASYFTQHNTILAHLIKALSPRVSIIMLLRDLHPAFTSPKWCMLAFRGFTQCSLQRQNRHTHTHPTPSPHHPTHPIHTHTPHPHTLHTPTPPPTPPTHTPHIYWNLLWLPLY